MKFVPSPLTPAGSKIVRVIAADKIFARILALLKGVESSFFYNKMVVDLVPVDHILIDSNPETA